MLACSKWCTVIVQLLLLAAVHGDASSAATVTTTTIIAPETGSTTSTTARTTAPPPPPASSTTTVVNSTATCQSVSVNYISPGLPVQCLRTRSTTSQPNPSSEQTSPPVTTAVGKDGEAADTPSALTASSAGNSQSSKLPSGTSIWLLSAEGTDVPVPSKISEEPPTKFLSFEEWKEQNLAKVGQSSDSFQGRGVREPKKAAGAGHGALDALGDEIEIAFEFGYPGPPAGTIEVSGTAVTDVPAAAAAAAMPRSKDAGKTCKERFNYASLDCAATVHNSNKGVKGANAILSENKESYMLNKCGVKGKFFIVELCEDILVDTVVLANFEFFSSVFREIRVSVSDKYPVKANGWKELGTYVARNTRDVQAFLVENPLIWARYMKIEILSHYGGEYYCPVSLLRVHGTTMMEEFRHEAAVARGGFEEDVREDVVPEAVAEPVKSAEDEEAEKKSAVQNGHEKTIETPPADEQPTVSVVIETSSSPVTTSHQPQQSLDCRYRFPVGHPSCPKDQPGPTKTLPVSHASTAPQVPRSAGTVVIPTIRPAVQTVSGSTTVSRPSVVAPVASDPAAVGSGGHHSARSESRIHEVPKPSSPQPPASSPTTQESFFKSVHKRLTHLEANSTLSLQYIEEQSRLMRDTFTKMEKSHMTKMEQLFELINTSAFADLKTYVGVSFPALLFTWIANTKQRDKYDQLWQSTVLALESQRSHSEREMLMISTRLTLLADEVIFQKRMYQLNTVLLVITIGVVLFSRNDRLAMPLTRHLRTKSSIRIFESPPTSPQMGGSTTPHLTRHRGNSSESVHSFGSPISPPTSREGSPVTNSKATFSPTSPKHRAERGWINFGPKLRVESRGRRWQRLPSPLAGSENGDPGEVVTVYNDGNASYFQDDKTGGGPGPAIVVDNTAA